MLALVDVAVSSTVYFASGRAAADVAVLGFSRLGVTLAGELARDLEAATLANVLAASVVALGA